MRSALTKVVSFGSWQQSMERNITGQSAENKRLNAQPYHTLPHSRNKAERMEEPGDDGGVL